VRKLRIYLPITAVALVGTFIMVTRVQKSELSDLEKEKAFKELMSEWQVDVLAPYKVMHYKKQGFRGGELLYFQFELRKDQANGWLPRLDDPRFSGKHTVLGTDKSYSIPIASQSQSKREILWSIEPRLRPVSPDISWWKAETPAMCFYGFMESDDKLQYIRFNIFERTNSGLAFVESLSRRGARK
jgi:hypothetical protein